MRDSGLVHALLGLPDLNAISGHPVAGLSWEGLVIENLIAAAPPLTQASFYRTAVGAEIDLLLDIPGHGLWAFDVKRGLSSKPEKAFPYRVRGREAEAAVSGECGNGSASDESGA